MVVEFFKKIKSFLFNNKTVKQTIFKNTVWLMAAEGSIKLLKLVLFIYIARILGATEYGQFSFGLAFVSLFIIFSDLGLPQIVTREFSQEEKKEKDFSTILSFKIFLGLATLILIFFSSFLITQDFLTRKIIWILGIYTVISGFSNIFYAFFQYRQKMEYQAIAKTIEALLLTGAGLFILFFLPSVENLSYSYLLAALIALIVVLVFFNYKIQKLSLVWDISVWRKYFKMSWPLALVAVFSSIYSQIDSVMMGHLGQITQTGWYNAASRIAWAAIIPAILIPTSFFPPLNKAFRETKERFQKIWDSQMIIMILLAVPIVVGGILLAPKIIDIIYGSEFAPASLAFQFLVVMVGLITIYNVFYWTLVVVFQQKKLFWTIFAGAMINVVLNLILIPKYSLYGAAIATVITHAIIFLLLAWFTIKLTTIKPFNSKIILTFLGAVFSSFIMYFVITCPLICGLNVVLSILIGGLVYALSVFALNLMLKYLMRIN